MSGAVSPPPKKYMTVEEFLTLPDDGIHRELIRGEVWEEREEDGMTARNRFHSDVEATISRLLGNWLETRPEPRGKIHSGEAGIRLRGTRESLVGIDVAFASAALVAETPPDQAFYNGPPILAVEVLSPSDTHVRIIAKVALYLEAGAVVWEVDYGFRTVRVHRPGKAPETFNEDQELITEPELPGFRVAVSRIFDSWNTR